VTPFKPNRLFVTPFKAAHGLRARDLGASASWGDVCLSDSVEVGLQRKVREEDSWRP
jgi:hypothetical protein